MSTNRLPLLAQRVLNTPLAIHPQKAAVIMAAVGQRFGVDLETSGLKPMAWFDEYDDDEGQDARAPDEGYDLVADVAIIPVEGTLVQKNGTIRPYSGMTGYDGIRSAFLTALNDERVKAIALAIDSPGGEVSGCFDLADLIFSARGRKKIWAILDESAYSAAYAIASACDRIVVPRTGGAGSIGVIAIMAEMSGFLKKEGITVNIMQFGARKADGNQFQALPAEARERFQGQVDAMGELFVLTVARNRGMDPAAVKATEAATFLAAEAKKIGLVDDIAAPDEALRQLVATLAD